MARFGRFRRKAPVRRRRLVSRRPRFGRFRKRPRRLPIRRRVGLLYDPYWMNSRTSVGSNWKWSSYNNDRLAASAEAVAADRAAAGRLRYYPLTYKYRPGRPPSVPSYGTPATVPVTPESEDPEFVTPFMRKRPRYDY